MVVVVPSDFDWGSKWFRIAPLHKFGLHYQLDTSKNLAISVVM